MHISQRQTLWQGKKARFQTFWKMNEEVSGEHSFVPWDQLKTECRSNIRNLRNTKAEGSRSRENEVVHIYQVRWISRWGHSHWQRTLALHWMQQRKVFFYGNVMGTHFEGIVLEKRANEWLLRNRVRLKITR